MKSSGLVYDRFPPLSAKYPWFVAQSLKDEEQNIQDQFLYTINNELPHYLCRIPELLGKRIRGCFYGWMILSNHPNNNKWSLWNQVTSKIISLPTLILKDGDFESIGQCCLSAPPDDPSSIFLLTRTNKSTFIFCRLNSKRKKLRWNEMSYAYQLKRLTSDGKLVHSLTCCDGKVYALSTDGSFAHFVIQVDIVVKKKEVVITLILFGSCPFTSSVRCSEDMVHYLKGSSTELFYIEIYFEEEIKRTHKTPAHVYLFKLDMTNIKWEERERLKKWDMTGIRYGECDDLGDSDTSSEILEDTDVFKDLDMSREMWEELDDLKGANFFVDLARDHLVSYSRVIASELGRFIHIRGEMGKTIYSYHVKDDTISLFPIPSPMSLWEYRLEDDHGESKCIINSKEEMENVDDILLRSGMDDGVEFNESRLLSIPFNSLETIMEFCVGVEYMNFRATCKKCHLAAPLTKWSNETSLSRLQTYSAVSPWLMVVEKRRGIITFKDPLMGNNYYMKNSQVPIVDDNIFCSRFGWLLIESNRLECLVFFNPFTNDLKRLPELECSLESLCFSAPPTSRDCMVVGFTTQGYWHVDILLVNQERTWRTFPLGPDPHTICFSTFRGRDLYALCKEGEVIVINNLGNEDCSWKLVESEAPKGCCRSLPQYFLTNWDQHLLLVSVGEYGETIEVFKRNYSKQEWEKINDVGKHMIYICGTTCLCIEAKIPQMENKIFFPQLHTKNKKVVFYSLDTYTYHTFDDKNIQENLRDFFGTTYHLTASVWIEPSWS